VTKLKKERAGSNDYATALSPDKIKIKALDNRIGKIYIKKGYGRIKGQAQHLLPG